jgi:hypothetical protein
MLKTRFKESSMSVKKNLFIYKVKKVIRIRGEIRSKAESKGTKTEEMKKIRSTL